MAILVPYLVTGLFYLLCLLMAESKLEVLRLLQLKQSDLVSLAKSSSLSENIHGFYARIKGPDDTYVVSVIDGIRQGRAYSLPDIKFCTKHLLIHQPPNPKQTCRITEISDEPFSMEELEDWEANLAILQLSSVHRLDTGEAEHRRNSLKATLEVRDPVPELSRGRSSTIAIDSSNHFIPEPILSPKPLLRNIRVFEQLAESPVVRRAPAKAKPSLSKFLPAPSDKPIEIVKATDTSKKLTPSTRPASVRVSDMAKVFESSDKKISPSPFRKNTASKEETKEKSTTAPGPLGTSHVDEQTIKEIKVETKSNEPQTESKEEELDEPKDNSVSPPGVSEVISTESDVEKKESKNTEEITEEIKTEEKETTEENSEQEEINSPEKSLDAKDISTEEPPPQEAPSDEEAKESETLPPKDENTSEGTVDSMESEENEKIIPVESEESKSELEKEAISEKDSKKLQKQEKEANSPEEQTKKPKKSNRVPGSEKMDGKASIGNKAFNIFSPLLSKKKDKSKKKGKSSPQSALPTEVKSIDEGTSGSDIKVRTKSKKKSKSKKKRRHSTSTRSSTVCTPSADVLALREGLKDTVDTPDKKNSAPDISIKESEREREGEVEAESVAPLSEEVSVVSSSVDSEKEDVETPDIESKAKKATTIADNDTERVARGGLIRGQDKKRHKRSRSTEERNLEDIITNDRPNDMPVTFEGNGPRRAFSNHPCSFLPIVIPPCSLPLMQDWESKKLRSIDKIEKLNERERAAFTVEEGTAAEKIEQDTSSSLALLVAKQQQEKDILTKTIIADKTTLRESQTQEQKDLKSTVRKEIADDHEKLNTALEKVERQYRENLLKQEKKVKKSNKGQNEEILKHLKSTHAADIKKEKSKKMLARMQIGHKHERQTLKKEQELQKEHIVQSQKLERDVLILQLSQTQKHLRQRRWAALDDVRKCEDTYRQLQERNHQMQLRHENSLQDVAKKILDKQQQMERENRKRKNQTSDKKQERQKQRKNLEKVYQMNCDQFKRDKNLDKAELKVKLEQLKVDHDDHMARLHNFASSQATETSMEVGQALMQRHALQTTTFRKERAKRLDILLAFHKKEKEMLQNRLETERKDIEHQMKASIESFQLEETTMKKAFTEANETNLWAIQQKHWEETENLQKTNHEEQQVFIGSIQQPDPTPPPKVVEVVKSDGIVEEDKKKNEEEAHMEQHHQFLEENKRYQQEQRELQEQMEKQLEEQHEEEKRLLEEEKSKEQERLRIQLEEEKKEVMETRIEEDEDTLKWEYIRKIANDTGLSEDLIAKQIERIGMPSFIF